MTRRFLTRLGLVLLLANTALTSFSQNVGINETGSLPDNSAMLDVQSTTKGMLVPRMTTVQRTAIATPAAGLLVYDITTNTFWFHNGTAWKELIDTVNPLTDADTDTRVNVEESPDEDIIRFDVAGTEMWRMRGSRIEQSNTESNIFIGNSAGQVNAPNAGTNAGYFNTFVGDRVGGNNTTGKQNTGIGTAALGEMITGDFNTAVGNGALALNTNGSSNTAIGNMAMLVGTTGSSNTAVGEQALRSNTGNNNTALGYGAMPVNTFGVNNVAVGYRAMFLNTLGGSNVALGYRALNANTSGTNNVAIGDDAGGMNVTGSSNVYIGSKAGALATGSNELYIDNSSISNPLIHGNFASNQLTINGSLGVTDLPAFAVDLTNSSTHFNTGWVEVTGWNTTATGLHNDGGHFNLGNGRFTAPYNGLYFFSAQVRLDGTSSPTGGFYRLVIAVNGVANIHGGMHAISDHTSGTWTTLNVSGVVKLSAGQYVSCFIESGTDTNWNIQSESGFSGYMITRQ